MIVIYDLTRIYSRRNKLSATGIDRVDINYCIHLINQKHSIIFVIGKSNKLITLESNKAIKIISEVGKRWIDQRIHCTDTILTTKFKLVDKIINTHDNYLYINICHNFLCGYESIINFSLMSNFRLIFYCHDLIPIDYPEYVNHKATKKHSEFIKLMLKVSDMVIVNSQYTKNRLLDFASKKRLEIPTVKILKIGVETKLTNISWKASDHHEHFIFISTFEPRKNHILLFLCWKKLFSILREKTPKLLLVGKEGWNMEWLKYYINADENIRKLIQHKTNVSDSELKELLLKSYASLNPSYVEGWGMSAVESIAIGLPTVCSDIPAYREATQNAAKYLSPLNVDAWVEHIIYLLKQKNSYVKKPTPETWDYHFLQLEKIIKNIKPKKNKINDINQEVSNLQRLSREIRLFNIKRNFFSFISKYMNRK